MALQKQAVAFNFAQGVDTKSDPKQIPIGKFYDLQNSIFDKQGLLKKRNGYQSLAVLPSGSGAYAATLNNNLLAVADSLYAYSSSNDSWSTRGPFNTANLSTLSLLKTNYSKPQVDSAIAANGLICIAYTQSTATSGVYTFNYSVIDSVTGQFIVSPTLITPTAGTVSGYPKVFLLGAYFIVVFPTDVGAGNYDLQYIAITTASPTTVSAAVTIATDYKPTTNTVGFSFDGTVANNVLYLAWNTVYQTGPISMKTLSTSLVLSSASTFAIAGDSISVCSDTTGVNPVIYVVGYNSGTQQYKLFSVDSSLSIVTAITVGVSSAVTLNITASAQNGIVSIVTDSQATYSYDSAIQLRKLSKNTYTVGVGFAGTSVLKRSLGLASESFIIGGTVYVIGVYSANTDTVGSAIANLTTQPTFFLINISGEIIAKLAYSNAGGYTIQNTPSVSVSSNTAKFPYLFQDALIPISKSITSGVSTSTATYSQVGINLASIGIKTNDLSSVEIANTVAISGGLTWMYDGDKPVELGFNLWPDLDPDLDSNGTSKSCVVGASGSISAQNYFYIATYEWTDNAGNVHRSAPSIAAPVTAASTSGGGKKITVNVPTLRVTSKGGTNPVRIVIYRWSTAQQTFFQVTPILSPLLNDTTVDSVSFADTFSDAQISGNLVLYTTGGVVENIAPPASSGLTVYKSRVFLIDSEDRNLIWYSKQVIEATPIEMSDLFTIYVGPTANANVSSGPITALAVMDDKLIIFKENDLFYITGNGPDNTGANNDFSDPIYISSIAGCSNKQSIVQTPEGLMFQSSKGIWLLSRSMQVSYIGAPVEQYNSYSVLSAVNVIGTNQVRFAMSNNLTLMYDYFYGQWGTFTGLTQVSGTIYSDSHTFINSSGQVFKELPGQYYDGTISNPVLMAFTTGQLNVAGLMGFERAYFFTFLGDYISPHSLTCNIAYDYGAFTQASAITPDSSDALEEWQVFFRQQKCQTVQLNIQESFDTTGGATPGAGLNLSGLNFQIGVKGTSPKLKQTVSVG